MIGLKEGKTINIYNEIVNQTKILIGKELEQIDCEEVAQYNGYSKKQMNRIFMSQTEMSVGEYILYKKLAQAVLDLMYTNVLIIEVALKNGFQTQESFTRAFRKAFHVTPHQFRMKHVWLEKGIEEHLSEVLQETSHEYTRAESVELSVPHVSLIHKPQSVWCSIKKNGKGLFPHNFYVECEKNHSYEKVQQICEKKEIGGAYLSHIFLHQKFVSLTLGFEIKENEAYLYQELDQYIMPEFNYLVVNVPSYCNYELGAHVLATWNVFSEFDYSAHQLKRDYDHAPIYEWDSAIDGYTMFFPVIKINGG